MGIQPKKNIMPMQAPCDRIHNFNEVALGYTDEIARKKRKKMQKLKK